MYLNESMKQAISDEMYILLEGISTDYREEVVDRLIDYVVEDIEATRDEETGSSFNEDDIRLAIGRVLLNLIPNKLLKVNEDRYLCQMKINDKIEYQKDVNTKKQACAWFDEIYFSKTKKHPTEDEINYFNHGNNVIVFMNDGKDCCEWRMY